MKVNRKMAIIFSVMALLVAFSPMTVFATDSGSAVKDILMDPRFEGAMSSVQWLTEMIDNWFIKIITVTAFFIISMALLKNALAAAYCAFPKIFDAIHTAHEEMAWSEVSIGGIKELGGKLRDKSITKVLLSILPDIKAFTDFVDQDQTPKSYFMKAIPQMCIMVIMGIFIYNGYYRDVSATVGEAGATIVENVLGSVSPEKAVNDMFNMKSDPKNTYRNDKTYEGGYIRDISNACYKQIKAYSTIVKQSAENKENLLRSCEFVAYNMVKGNTVPGNDETGGKIFETTDTYDYKLSNVQVTISTVGTGEYCTTDTSDATKAFRYEIGIDNFMGGATSEAEEELKGRIVVITGNLTPVAKSNKTYATNIEAIQGSQSASSAGFTSITITASAGQVGAQWNNNDAYCDIKSIESLAAGVLKSKIAETMPGCTLVEDSVQLTNTSEAYKVKLHAGNNSNCCKVVFQYVTASTDMQGNTTPGSTKKADAWVTIELSQ